jgi:hypothetical protein
VDSLQPKANRNNLRLGSALVKRRPPSPYILDELHSGLHIDIVAADQKWGSCSITEKIKIHRT